MKKYITIAISILLFISVILNGIKIYEGKMNEETIINLENEISELTTEANNYRELLQNEQDKKDEIESLKSQILKLESDVGYYSNYAKEYIKIIDNLIEQDNYPILNVDNKYKAYVDEVISFIDETFQNETVVLITINHESELESDKMFIFEVLTISNISSNEDMDFKYMVRDLIVDTTKGIEIRYLA